MRWERKSEEPLLGLKMIAILCVMTFLLFFGGCGRQVDVADRLREADTMPAHSSQTRPVQPKEELTDPLLEDRAGPQDVSEQIRETSGDKIEMRMFINGTGVAVAWEENESVDKLREMAAEGLEISMSMYGGFEQVGQVGQDVPSNDEQMTTKAGDIVLYSGNQIVVFYGTNSWSYTRLGHITDKTAEELGKLLGEGDVTIRISMEDGE